MGSFRPSAGIRHFHRHYNFTEILVETAPKLRPTFTGALVRSFALPLTPCLDLSALVTCHTLCLLFTSSQSAMFLLNSRMGPFTAPPGIALEDPFSRSYGAMLPSSLTRFLPRALVSLYPPTCVGFGTAGMSVSHRFSWKHGCMALSGTSPGLGAAVGPPRKG